MSILGPQIGENCFLAPQIFKWHVWKESKLFQNASRRVTKFGENRPREVEKSVVENK